MHEIIRPILVQIPHQSLGHQVPVPCVLHQFRQYSMRRKPAQRGHRERVELIRAERGVEIGCDGGAEFQRGQAELVLSGEDQSQADARLSCAHVFADDAARGIVIIVGLDVCEMGDHVHEEWWMHAFWYWYKVVVMPLGAGRERHSSSRRSVSGKAWGWARIDSGSGAGDGIPRGSRASKTESAAIALQEVQYYLRWKQTNRNLYRLRVLPLEYALSGIQISLVYQREKFVRLLGCADVSAPPHMLWDNIYSHAVPDISCRVVQLSEALASGTDVVGLGELSEGQDKVAGGFNGGVGGIVRDDVWCEWEPIGCGDGASGVLRDNARWEREPVGEGGGDGGGERGKGFGAGAEVDGANRQQVIKDFHAVSRGEYGEGGQSRINFTKGQKDSARRSKRDGASDGGGVNLFSITCAVFRSSLATNLLVSLVQETSNRRTEMQTHNANLIRRLDDTAIRQLRAYTQSSSLVVTSVAQCVVELIQNALDAKATAIEVNFDIFKYFVQVTDNGVGITPYDLKNVGQRYATSKCHTLQDLQNVLSFGFRGEALASIAEVAVLEVISKHVDFFDTFHAILKNGTLLDYGPSKYARKPKPGTTVVVRDLFYKVRRRFPNYFPVRRKQHVLANDHSSFSSTSSSTHFDNASEAVRRAVESIALIFPEVTFTLVDAAKDVRVVTTRKVRWVCVCGYRIGSFDLPAAVRADFDTVYYFIPQKYQKANYIRKLETVYAEEDEITITGFISLKGFHTKYHQYIYVNNRLIGPNEIHKSINQLFGQSGFGRQLFLTMLMVSSRFFVKAADELGIPLADDEPAAGKGKQTGSPIKRTVERYPVFLLHLKCPPSDYDVCLDPAKSIIEFQVSHVTPSNLSLPNWPQIHALVAALVAEFLHARGLLADARHQALRLARAADPAVMARGRMVRVVGDRPRGLELAFEDVAHVKSSGVKVGRAVFEEGELKGGNGGGGGRRAEEEAKGGMVGAKEVVVRVGEQNVHFGFPIWQNPSEVELMCVVDDSDAIKTDMTTYQKWADPLTKKAFYVDIRTGNSYTSIPGCSTPITSSTSPTSSRSARLSSQGASVATIDRSRLRGLGRSSSSSSKPPTDSAEPGRTPGATANLWAQDAFRKWADNNPVFRTPEVPIPSLSGAGGASVLAGSLRKGAIGSFFSSARPFEPDAVQKRISKEGLKHTRVIAQVDCKFIVARIPAPRAGDGKGDEDTQDVLVLIDQHAADERVRVEMLMKEFVGWDEDRSSTDPLSTNPTTTTDTIPIHPPTRILLTPREWQVVRRFEPHFLRWGIELSVSPPPPRTDANLVTGADGAGSGGVVMTRTTSSHFGTGPKSRHFGAPSRVGASREEERETAAHVTVYVTRLPRLIADRCVADPRVVQEVVRGYLYWLDETGGIVGTGAAEEGEWLARLRGCPRGVLDILNSKACRGG
ncbi:hypothetical protein BC938DRAFT_483883 [Jimgerdemannia flammicorona]|uniref:MutL C-terminal dimerisation domain-containing protein n=1 Tax=Jimgerdemannia flammicorona TaxID=994334 RepID=A0A433QB10_9FUNG|nr:hypothetical protein BC938DRAFT_483883 [Jimgerdemannia flammicorona]